MGRDRAQRRLTLALVVCGVGGLGGCTDSAPREPIGSARQAVVYGSDDRHELFQEQDPAWRSRLRGAAVALIPRKDVRVTPGGSVRLPVRTLQARYALCEGEPFAEQAASADCSATLIDEDLVLTAGHCFENDTECDRYAYVFDYLYRADGVREELDADDVYGCKAILTRKASALDDVNYLDYAVVQLDRPVAATRTPLTLSRRKVALDERVVVVGFPGGLPAKIDHGARVRSVDALHLQRFALDSDTFAVSSGSGVFDGQGALVGVLVSGGIDYAYDASAGCQRTQKLDAGEAGAPWEQATYSASAVDALCAAGWPNLTLCDRAPQCGDGFCSSAERDDCEADCGAVTCEDAGCAEQVEVATTSQEAGTPKDGAADAGLRSESGQTSPTSQGCAVSHAGQASTLSQLPWLLSLGLAARGSRPRTSSSARASAERNPGR